MRIVSGRFRGHRLHGPKDNNIRPTSDRIRESLFNILINKLLERPGEPAPLAGYRVLDLFAGTGALGLEALSRGADFVLFVEHDATARGIIRSNLEKLGVMRETQIYRRDATRLGPRPRNQAPFDLIFLDPPYGRDLAAEALRGAIADDWFAKEAIIIVEDARSASLPPIAQTTLIETRTIGETALHLLRFGPTTNDNKK